MTFPGSILEQIDDELYMYYTTLGDECIDIKWCGFVIVITTSAGSDKGSIEIYQGREDVTPNIFPDKDVSKKIPATAHNLFGVMTLLYKRAKKKGD